MKKKIKKINIDEEVNRDTLLYRGDICYDKDLMEFKNVVKEVINEGKRRKHKDEK